MDPVAFSIGPITVYWYGILIVGGAVLGAWISAREAQRRGYDPDHVWNMLIVVLLFGIIGARLYHVFSQPAVGIGWDYYREHPIDAIAFWKGFSTGEGGFRGLGIYGGIIGGIVGIFVYTWYMKLKFLEWLDIAVPALMLAQAIGRWGNYINKELFGPPTELPWGIDIPCAFRAAYADLNCNVLGPATRFHPTFLYESLWSLVGLAMLLVATRKIGDWLRTGDLIYFYLIWYPLGRFWIELFFRPDAWTWGTLPTASVISLISIALGIAGFIYNRVIRSKPEPVKPAKAARKTKPGRKKKRS